MKNRKNELDVDFIGGEGPLTEQEKKALNDYFNSKKTKKQSTPKKHSSKRVKVLV